jgi:N-acyl-D-aspartate/D-glutamate deacylase
MVISHHKATGGPMNWNKTAATISMMNRAVEEGLDVFCDQYPYTASATGLQTNIPDALHVLGVEKLVEMLTTAEGREQLRPEICGSKDSWTRFQYTMIGNSKSKPEYAGRMLNDIAREEGKDPYDIQCDLLRDDRLGTGAIFHTMSEEDVERVMQWPRAMVGTDGQYAPGTAGGHPRSFATFPRVLGRYVREKKIITLENAIRKMTSLPAMVYNLPTKGVIREGMDADLVLFDPETVADLGDFTQPTRGNTGFACVLVNGQIALENDCVTDTLAGKPFFREAD